MHLPHFRALRLTLGTSVLLLLVAATSVACNSEGAFHTIFDDQVPGTPSVSDSKGVELGMRFTSSLNGNVIGVRFYKGPANTGTHTGHLWSSSGALLATTTFANESASGWQTALFPKEQPVTAGTTYVISYFAPTGHYSADLNYFRSAKKNGPLTALADGQDGPSGAFRYGANTGFPASQWNATNYWVDPFFQEDPNAPTTTAPATTTTAKPATTTTSTPASTTTTRAPATTTTATTAPPATTTPPPTGGFPSPSNTGWSPTGVTLTPYTGPSIITTANTVIDGKDITTCLSVQAKNVTIKRSRVRCGGNFGIEQRGAGQGLLVEDVEITSGSSMLDRAILFTDGGIMRRLYIHGMQRGIAVGSNTTVEYSYVGENQNGTDAHTSAIMTSGGTSHVIVRFNTLQTAPNTNASSAISFYPEVWAGGANDDFLIEGNLLNSGGEYAIYLGYTPPEESPNTHFRFINNRFGTLYFPLCGMSGPVASWSNDPTNTWSGNTWYDLRPTGGGYTNKDGKPVNP